jgi:hypothetical protein
MAAVIDLIQRVKKIIVPVLPLYGNRQIMCEADGINKIVGRGCNLGNEMEGICFGQSFWC